jgi:ACS family tartrate transporter-like MFS transporter
MMSSEAALIRKISIRLIPFLFLLYIVSYLDRVNVSFASLQMNKALGFSAEFRAEAILTKHSVV